MVELQQDPALLHCFQIQNQDVWSILPVLPSSLLPLLGLDPQSLALQTAKGKVQSKLILSFLHDNLTKRKV